MPGIITEFGGALVNAAFGVVLAEASEERSWVDDPTSLIVTPQVQQAYRELWENLDPEMRACIQGDRSAVPEPRV